MKGSNRKKTAVLSTLVLSSLLAAACGNNNANNAASSAPATAGGSASSTASAAAQIDNSKEVKLVGYLLGEAPKGMPEVLEAVNAKLKQDVNATLELNYIGWGDIASKYPLVLASGEDVDFIFTADWNYYISEANKGAFMPLNEEMFKTYMPNYYAKQDPAAYKAAEVNGTQYMIPTTTPDRKVNVMVLRKDVMEKAGLTNPTKISELEPYFATIKKDYPDMIPLNLDSQYDLPTPFINLVREQYAYGAAPFDSGDPSSVGVTTDIEDPTGKILHFWDEPAASAMKSAANTMKGWYDAGYVNKNPFSNKVRSKDNFCEGQTGVAFGNSLDIQPTLATCANKGVETYIIPTLTPSGHSSANSWLNNGVAIAANSKNPERALQVLDRLMENEEYAMLVYYGIEGKNYTLTADGKLGLPEGVTQETNTFPADSSGFWFVDKDFTKPSVTWTNEYIELNNKVKDYLVPDTYIGFSFNSENVKAETANLKSVAAQYFLPITVGAVKDVEGAFNTLFDKMKSAGVEKVKTEVEAQASAFLANKGQ
ncbi:extracellular solute-binding protein [Cohnella sp. GCM10027633]|uniref:extracellular solute-binding protein n=1 Tax=unclassified Cohnella TaxID=2636738 RepID=UPI0036330329